MVDEVASLSRFLLLQQKFKGADFYQGGCAVRLVLVSMVGDPVAVACGLAAKINRRAENSFTKVVEGFSPIGKALPTLQNPGEGFLEDIVDAAPVQ